jgi:hypothetical protein
VSFTVVVAVNAGDLDDDDLDDDARPPAMTDTKSRPRSPGMASG